MVPTKSGNIALTVVPEENGHFLCQLSLTLYGKHNQQRGFTGKVRATRSPLPWKVWLKSFARKRKLNKRSTGMASSAPLRESRLKSDSM